PTVPVPDEGPALPQSRFLVADTLVRFDHANGVVDVLYGNGAELDEAHPPLEQGRSHPRPTRRFPSQREYEDGVRRAKREIAAGEAFQIVLSQRAERPTNASPVELYRALRRINPSPYLFLLELDGVSLVGSSPETLVKLEGRRASVNPIAGTIASGDGGAEQFLGAARDRAG